MLTDDASIWVWGESKAGALAIPSTTRLDKPTKLDSIQGVSSIKCGPDVLSCITEDRKLFLSGLLPDGTTNVVLTEYTWPYEGSLLAINFAATFSIVLTEDRVCIN